MNEYKQQQQQKKKTPSLGEKNHTEMHFVKDIKVVACMCAFFLCLVTMQLSVDRLIFHGRFTTDVMNNKKTQIKECETHEKCNVDIVNHVNEFRTERKREREHKMQIYEKQTHPLLLFQAQRFAVLLFNSIVYSSCMYELFSLNMLMTKLVIHEMNCIPIDLHGSAKHFTFTNLNAAK